MLIRADVMAEHRTLAISTQDRPASFAGAAALIVIWLAAIALTGWLGYRYLSG
jgi:hypothetical protein